jgi:hypothetical protein
MSNRITELERNWKSEVLHATESVKTLVNQLQRMANRRCEEESFNLLEKWNDVACEEEKELEDAAIIWKHLQVVQDNVQHLNVERMKGDYIEQTLLLSSSIEHLKQIIESFYSDGIVNIDAHALRPKLMTILVSWIHLPLLA